MRNTLLAHGKALSVIRSGARTAPRIGLALNASIYTPVNGRSLDEAKEMTFADPHSVFCAACWMDPIVKGELPDFLKGYVSDLRYVFSAEGAKSLGGFGAIGSLFPPTWDWHSFWLMTAFLSIILAFMNILPIPALDGGHVLFLLYEIITGRKPSENFMIKAEYVGFTILILLMIVANLNDILRWLGYM